MNQTNKTEEQSAPALTQAIIDAIQDRKGHGITLIDLSELETASAPELVICEGNTPTQVAAIADSVREQVQASTARSRTTTTDTGTAPG